MPRSRHVLQDVKGIRLVQNIDDTEALIADLLRERVREFVYDLELHAGNKYKEAELKQLTIGIARYTHMIILRPRTGMETWESAA
jgi:cytochrome c-type biogenesis protein CcmH/NrfF